MKTRSEIARSLFLGLGGGISGIVILSGNGARLLGFATATGLIFAGIAALLFSIFASTIVSKSLFVRFAANTAPIPTPTRDETRKPLKAEVLKMLLLFHIAIALFVVGAMLSTKLEMHLIGAVVVALALIPSIAVYHLWMHISKLQSSPNAPETEVDRVEQTSECKSKFYLSLIALVEYVSFAAFLFSACVYLLVTGERGVLLTCLLFLGLFGLSLIPYFSGLVVRKLGLPEEIET